MCSNQGMVQVSSGGFTFRNIIKGVLVEKYKSEVFLDQNRHHSNSSSSHFQSLKHQSSYQHLSIITHSSLLYFHFHFHSHLSSSNSKSTNTSTIKMQPQTLASIIAFLCAVSSAAPVTGKPIHNNFISQEPSLTQLSLSRLHLQRSIRARRHSIPRLLHRDSLPQHRQRRSQLRAPLQAGWRRLAPLRPI